MRNGSLFASFRFEAKKKYKRKSNTLGRTPSASQGFSHLSLSWTERYRYLAQGDKYHSHHSSRLHECSVLSVSRFGAPGFITSDHGAQFTSSLWAALCNLIKIKHTQTTAYHQHGTNGLVEHFRYRLKDVLRARCDEINWTDHLPWVLLGLCSAAREDDNTTPAQAVFSSLLILLDSF